MGQAVSRRPWRRTLSRAAMLSGLVLLAVAALFMWRHWNAPPPYQYVLGDVLAADKLGPLADANPPIALRRATVVAPDREKPLAELEVAESGAGPVLVAWQARVDDPFLTLSVPLDDVAALAPVLLRHVEPGTPLLAWWDSSRQLKLLADLDYPFDQYLGLPLFLPARWEAQRAGVQDVEHTFWQAASGQKLDAAQQRFHRFADALLAPEEEGVAMLQALAGDRKAVLVLHLRDLILLGQMAPRQLGVAFRDFGGSGDVHGTVRGVRGWMEQHDYAAYGLQRRPDGLVRAVALTDDASARTLAARLLPLIGNDQHDVPGTRLVYRAGGFVVFEIAPASAAGQAGAGARAAS